jgi:hypothetical protein
MSELHPTLDRSALRVNQAVIVALLVLAFVGGWPWLVAGVAAVMAVGALTGRPGFGIVYSRFLRPAGWVRPERTAEDPAPHRFAQAFGSAMLVAATAALLGGQALAGWALVWIVVALAALNLGSGICVGCALHHRLARLGLPPFARGSRPEGEAHR